MKLDYCVDDKPKLADLLIFGLQWLVVSIPAILIIGKVVADLHGSTMIPYLQKLFFIVAVILIVQIYLGHRLPVVIGPAAILLTGILASLDAGIGAINASMLIGGLALAAVAALGLFKYLQRLITPRVIVVVLILIAFSLAPVILDLFVDGGGTVSPSHAFSFALVFTLILFIANGLLKGVWRSTLPLWAIIFGTVAYIAMFGSVPLLAEGAPLMALPTGLVGELAVPSIGVLAAFMICFLALSINELGSIESVGGMLNADDMEGRVKRGVTVSGLGNAVSGFCGIIGSVGLSLSPGIIAATRCASRFALVPAGIVLILLSMSPFAVGYLGSIPGPVIGVVLAFVLASQISAGLMMSHLNSTVRSFDDGMIIGVPLLIGTLVSFLPNAVASEFPAIIAPIVTNGFVMGVLAVLVLEHLVYRKRSKG